MARECPQPQALLGRQRSIGAFRPPVGMPLKVKLKPALRRSLNSRIPLIHEAIAKLRDASHPLTYCFAVAERNGDGRAI